MKPGFNIDNPCNCHKNSCLQGVTVPKDCAYRLSGVLEVKICTNDKHKMGGTWHRDGKCLVCFPPNYPFPAKGGEKT